MRSRDIAVPARGVRIFGLGAFALAASLWATGADAQSLRSRGTIDQLDGDSIGIKTFDGYRTFYKVAAYSLVTTLRPVAVSAIAKKQTVRLAISEERGNGVFIAAAAQVFPSGDLTIGTSRYLWDMTPLGSVVDASFDQTVDMPNMPDGKPIAGIAARFLVSDRPVTVIFPPGCPVTTFAESDKKSLRVGMPVFVYGQMTGDHPIEVALTDPSNLAPKK